ncbi:Ig-like domain-containing protein [Paenibacillus sp. N1-5-1-14]|uniref:S-layer homology domain-containing protein n=1 Tax=Paenibacillus radicibacter TaxID=2972488 RepID=UPI0021599F75|nr:Ig-like domain-containing protein [Paenibacillus radicibacter]MCR8643808.1 Ig-like domain-containing protein [Paenibacillus radicibacter]
MFRRLALFLVALLMVQAISISIPKSALAASNRAPVAINGTLTVMQNQAALNYLQATDADRDSLTFIIVTQPSKGSVALTNKKTGEFVYTPKSNVSGSDSFTFKVDDGEDDSNLATMKITITAPNVKPVAIGANIATTMNAELAFALQAVDSDNNTLTYSIVSAPTKGKITFIDKDKGTIRYKPNLNVAGTDSFTFKVNDGRVDSAPATVNVSIYGNNEPPVAASLVITGTPQVGKTLTANYIYWDPENDPEGRSLIRWYAADPDGTDKRLIANETSTTLRLTSAHQGKIISFRVTPVSSTGNSTGSVVESPATPIIVDEYGAVDPNSTYIEIQTPYGVYRIAVNRASLIPGLSQLLAANNLRVEDVKLNISLRDQINSKDIRSALSKDLPSANVLGAVVDYNIDIINRRTGRTLTNSDSISLSLPKLIPLPKNMTHLPDAWGAFHYNTKTKSFEFVPARQITIDGVTYAVITSGTNDVYVVVENQLYFSDTQYHWGKWFVQNAAAKGLLFGVGNNLFDPEKSVTRAEFTSMIVRALGQGTSASNRSYNDVPANAWYAGTVAKAKELGLLNFASPYYFYPDDPITREEMASVLAAVVKLQKTSTTMEYVSLNQYQDIRNADPSLLEDIRLIVKLKVMTGTSNDTFSPKGETTRAQAAVVLIKILQTTSMID